MADEAVRGRFVWHELATTDVDAAQSFYTDVVGWGTQPSGQVTGMRYELWTADGAPVAGLMELAHMSPDDAGVPPHWLTYVGAPDVDATAARAAELGGRVLVPAMDIPGVGRFAVLQDPQGGTFGVLQPNMPAGEDRPAAVGEFSWHELMTTDVDAAVAFYSDLFGWEKTEAMDMGEYGVYQMYGHHGRTLGGIFRQTGGAQVGWLAYARVPDVNEAAERVKRDGGRILNGPMEVPGGDWIVQFADPQGAVLAVHHTAAQ